MVVTNKFKKILLSFFVLITNFYNAFGEMLQKGKTKVKTVFNVYHQNSNDGKQVYDNSGREEVNVVEPMIFVEHQITKDTAIDAHFVVDLWTAASDTKIDGATGASGPGRTNQSRVSGSIGTRTEKKSSAYGLSFGFSSEYDYSSLNFSANFERSFAKDNFTVGVGVQYYDDKVWLFEDLSSPLTAKISEDKPRKIISSSLTASQILTPKDIIQFGFTFAKATKFLESTASTVSVAGVREVESLPDNRHRYALSSTWVHGLGETSAMNIQYRYYMDNWGLKANTLRGAFLFETNDDEDFVEIFARYHSQGSVDYYKNSFSQAQKYMTSDSDLEKFSSYELGLYHTKTFEDFKFLNKDFENISWANGYVYSLRSKGLRYGYIQSSINVEF